MSDLKDRACKARQKLAEEVKSFETASERLGNQEVRVDDYDLSNRVEVQEVTICNDYFDVDV